LLTTSLAQPYAMKTKTNDLLQGAAWGGIAAIILSLLTNDKLQEVVRYKSWFGSMDCGLIMSGQPDVIGPGVNYKKFDAH
jgi:hypothetical protein